MIRFKHWSPLNYDEHGRTQEETAKAKASRTAKYLKRFKFLIYFFPL